MVEIVKNQLVVNWHILEECNFGCKYCYAHWPDNPSPQEKEAWKNEENSNKILDELSHMSGIVAGEWVGPPRLNIAGGEPMLLWKNDRLLNVMDKARQLGFSLSIITNGFNLTNDVLLKLAPKLQILGISMDSANPTTNEKIGRCSKGKSEQIDYARIGEIFRLAREINSQIECKLNTVICAENWQEDFHPVIQAVSPDRWKVFQMLPVANNQKIATKQQPLVIMPEQFDNFKSRHKDVDIMRPEDNDQMSESYVMVDPHGRFFQNTPAGQYITSPPIHKVGAKEAWQEMKGYYDPKKYNNRYISIIKIAD